MYRRGGLGDCFALILYRKIARTSHRNNTCERSMGAALNKAVITNLACCVCSGMHNEFGESRPVGGSA